MRLTRFILANRTSSNHEAGTIATWINPEYVLQLLEIDTITTRIRMDTKHTVVVDGSMDDVAGKLAGESLYG